MGGGSRSSSSTSNQSTQIDARSVIDQSGNQGTIAGAGAVANSGNTITTYNTTTDGGAVRAALDFADNLGGNALETGLDALREANRTVRDTTTTAIDFAEGAQRGAFDFADTFAGRAIDLVQRTSSGALATVERAYTDAKGEGVAARYAVWGALAVAGVAVVATVMRR